MRALVREDGLPIGSRAIGSGHGHFPKTHSCMVGGVGDREEVGIKISPCSGAGGTLSPISVC